MILIDLNLLEKLAETNSIPVKLLQFKISPIYHCNLNLIIIVI